MSDLTLVPHVEIINGNVRTTSLKIAEHFGKRHDTVLRAVRNLECSDDFRLRNFAECSRINELANNKREPYYEMTRDGFTFVAMGFTGKEAAKWKESYIDAFNRMEAELYAKATTQNGLKSLESPTLTASDQQTLSEIVDFRARDFGPLAGKAKSEIWSRVHRKFRVAKYQQLPREQLSDAITYVMNMDIRTKAPALPSGQYDAPLSMWKLSNRKGATGWLTYSELSQVDGPMRPISTVLCGLTNGGHDVSGAQAEYDAMRLLLDYYHWRLDTIATIFRQMDGYGLNISQH